jgi:Fe-S-cluster-containing dehydrogenase component
MNERTCHQGRAEASAEGGSADRPGAQPVPASPPPTSAGEACVNERREFLKGAIIFISAGGLMAGLGGEARGAAETSSKSYNPADHLYGMGIEIDKCIGCNRCAVACKVENDVPEEPVFFRTWVERFTILRSGEVNVENISGPRKTTVHSERDVLRTFFVPKLCNHCANPPCVQVCPVKATFTTQDGAVIVDSARCVGCRYCIQACPYGARYLNPKTNTADKCTFCYHRVVKGLQPACVEVCPTQARIFGDLKSKASRLVRFERMNKISVLKPDLNTKPKVHYAQLDGEVR